MHWFVGIPILMMALLMIMTVVFYNRLIRSRLLVQEGYSGMDVQLKRRHDLIPRLVETVRGYSNFEQSVLTELTQIRSAAINANNIENRERVESELESILQRLSVVVEAYPDLKANSQYLNLASDLVATEDNLQKSRRYYNGTVRNFNTHIESFPANLIAVLFAFQKEKYFQLDAPDERENPHINLSK